MTYELAKKLKDAGFPDPKHGDHNDGCYQQGAESVCAPTLSELIEACGDNFHSLTQYERGGKFGAMPVFEILKEKKEWFRAICDTPEEAVAHLWLELNKK